MEDDELIENFDSSAFKKAISQIESNSGKYQSNRSSSAAGRYHFLYNNIKDLPELKGTTKLEFINDSVLQESVMDKALLGQLKGYPHYIFHAQDLKDTYNSDLSNEELAAITHFLGKSGSRKYLSSQDSFKVPGNNATVKDYLSKFNSAFIPTSANTDSLSPAKLSSNDKERMEAMRVQQDGTSVYKPQPKEMDGFLKEFKEFSLGGQKGGQIGGQDNELIEFEGGGTHDQNPNGGIPIGGGDTVEEGETMTQIGDSSYIFSDRIGMYPREDVNLTVAKK